MGILVIYEELSKFRGKGGFLRKYENMRADNLQKDIRMIRKDRKRCLTSLIKKYKLKLY
jgi:hypothetical protein